jgi:hypothetical protein
VRGVYDQAYTSHRAETYDHTNFCDGYFRLRNLAEALVFGSQPTYRDNIIAYQSKGKLEFYTLKALTDQSVQR